jgi:hypothetical protein
MEVILPPFTYLVKKYYGNISRHDLREHLIRMTSNFYENFKHFNISTNNYSFDQRSNPFFMTPTNEDIVESRNTDYKELDSIIATSKKSIVFNPYIMMLYIATCKSNRAYTIGNWTIFSLAQIVVDFNKLVDMESDIKWCDIGHKYLGLGYYAALRMDITNGKLFIQTDGGSNGYDREHYWNNYKNQELKKSDYIEFNDLIKKLLDDRNE